MMIRSRTFSTFDPSLVTQAETSSYGAGFHIPGQPCVSSLKWRAVDLVSAAQTAVRTSDKRPFPARRGDGDHERGLALEGRVVDKHWPARSHLCHRVEADPQGQR